MVHIMNKFSMKGRLMKKVLCPSLAVRSLFWKIYLC